MAVHLITEGVRLLAGRQMTQFGLVVWALAATRGITSMPEISRRILSSCRENVSGDQVRNYLHGRSRVPHEFCSDLVIALELDQEESDRLAIAYAFGQDGPSPISGLPYENTA